MTAEYRETHTSMRVAGNHKLTDPLLVGRKSIFVLLNLKLFLKRICWVLFLFPKVEQ